MSHWKKRRRTKAGRIAVKPFFFLLLALFAAVDRQRLLFPILSAAALHEAGHLAVLRLVGGQIGQFTLTPFGGELRIRRSEWLSYGKEIASVLAGPGVSLSVRFGAGPRGVGFPGSGAICFSGIHMLLALFNLLPLRQLDGGRALYLMLSWLLDPITADRIGHGVSCFFLCVALLLTAALQGAVGLQLPLVVLEFWFVFVLVRRNRYCQITSLRVK